jgi:hypothetical protein
MKVVLGCVDVAEGLRPDVDNPPHLRRPALDDCGSFARIQFSPKKAVGL